VTEDYPRSTEEDYQQAIERKERGPAQVVDARFKLDAQELAPITAAFGKAALTSQTLVLMKGYNNQLRYWVFTNEEAAGHFLLENAGLDEALRKEKLQWKNLTELASALEIRANVQNQAFTTAKAGAMLWRDMA
jgi:hypothetical protein